MALTSAVCYAFGVLMIRENKSPAVIRDMLISYLPSKSRAEFQEAA